MRVEHGLAGLALVARPGQHRGFLLLLGGHGVGALEAGQLAVVVLVDVLPAAHGAGVLHLDVRIGLAGLGHHLLQRLVVADDGRVLPLLRVAELTGERVARGASGVAGHHHEVALAQRLVGEAQPLLRLVGHIVLGVGGRLAVLAHVGAVEGEVAGVPRPHPVVDLAAVRADAALWGIDQAHVADLEVLEQAVGVAAGEAVQAAAVAGIGLARGHQRLLDRIERLGAAGRVRGPRDRGLHAVGHVLDRLQREDARVRAGADLVADLRGIEAVAHQVVLGGRVELDRAVGAVVVGRHQALRRDEARGAAAQRHHRAQRIAGEVGQLLGCELQAGLAQRLRDLGKLLRHPHAFAGLDRCGAGEGGHEGRGGGGEKGLAHGLDVLVCGKGIRVDARKSSGRRRARAPAGGRRRPAAAPFPAAAAAPGRRGP